MSFEMFPKDRVTYLSENVFVFNTNGNWQVHFQVDHQTFMVGMDYDDFESAQWFGNQLIVALDKFANNEKRGILDQDCDLEISKTGDK